MSSGGAGPGAYVDITEDATRYLGLDLDLDVEPPISASTTSLQACGSNGSTFPARENFHSQGTQLAGHVFDVPAQAHAKPAETTGEGAGGSEMAVTTSEGCLADTSASALVAASSASEVPSRGLAVPVGTLSFEQYLASISQMSTMSSHGSASNRQEHGAFLNDEDLYVWVQAARLLSLSSGSTVVTSEDEVAD